VIIPLFQALVLECNFAVRDSWLIPNLYSCVPVVIFTGDLRYVTEIIGNHQQGFNDNDVERIAIVHQPMDFLPRNMSNFFPNVISIELADLGLTEITREDINGFPKLKQMNLNPNNIRELGNGVFEGNPELEKLALSGNPIKNIAHNVFDNLTKLTLLHMFTPCFNLFTDTREGIEDFIFRSSIHCPPTFKMIEERILNGIEFQIKIDEQVSERINPLTWTMFEMGNMAIDHEERIERLEILNNNL
jgi:Leucine-rich repeat (LRR) protein